MVLSVSICFFERLKKQSKYHRDFKELRFSYLFMGVNNPRRYIPAVHFYSHITLQYLPTIPFFKPYLPESYNKWCTARPSSNRKPKIHDLLGIGSLRVPQRPKNNGSTTRDPYFKVFVNSSASHMFYGDKKNQRVEGDEWIGLTLIYYTIFVLKKF